MKIYYEQGDRVKIKDSGDIGIVMEHDLLDGTILVKMNKCRTWVGEKDVLYYRVKEEEKCL